MNDPEFNDEELDALLQEVDVPADLKDQLRQISQQSPSQETPKSVRPPQTNGSLKRILAIAATLLAIVGFLTYSALTEKEQPIADNPTPEVDSTNSPDTTDLVDRATTQQMEELDQLVNELELSQLRSRLARLNESNSEFGYSTTANDTREYTAMILALSDQSAIDHGGSTDSVIDDMQFVIESFPGTEGAKLAEQFIVTSSGN